MEQKWIHILGILVFCREIWPGAGEEKTPNEGQSVTFNCGLTAGDTIHWFRVLDKSHVELIAPSKSQANSQMFRYDETKPKALTLVSFKRKIDGGLYVCVSENNNRLTFGAVTRLVGEKINPAPTNKPKLRPINPEPTCEDSCEEGETFFCSIFLLTALVGSCGLCLLLLVLITVYCNHTRTRRCPHHYKQRPRRTAPGKQRVTH